jgi:cysteine desulfurase / selenocysteine lyase
MAFRPEVVKQDFPILRQSVRGRPLVYLDNAATTQKPQHVIDSLTRYYTESNANVHRGVHFLSERATRDFEDARAVVQKFLGASSSREIVFVQGTTEGINLIATTLGHRHLNQGDEIVISAMEHHSNIVPWQMLRDRLGVIVKVAPITDDGRLDFDAFTKLLTPKTKLVSICHVSNALGTINPVGEISSLCRSKNILVHFDGAQAAPHLPVNVKELGCDFYTFSSHKIYGPTGIGALYGRVELLEELPPFQGGGDMIRSVTFEKTLYNEIPYKFEAGTPHIEGAIGFAAALRYLSQFSWSDVIANEHDVCGFGIEQLSKLDGLTLHGPKNLEDRTAVLSFSLKGIHPHDIGTIVDREGVAIRTGHHCAQPLMEIMGVPATARASVGIYNSRDDIMSLVDALNRVKRVFG